MSLIRLASNNVSNCSDGGTKDENSVLFSGNSNPNRRRSISSIVSAALRPRKLIDEPSEVSTGRSGVQYDTAAVANPKSNSSINEVHKSPADELQQKPTIERLKDRIGRGGAQVDENQGTIVAGSSNVSTPHAPVPNKLTTRQPTSSFILPPVPLDEIISSIDVTQGSTDYVIKSLEGLKESVANLLDWKNRLLASEAMPITALVPMTIAVSQIMRRQETHKDSMLLLLDEVKKVMPKSLLEERKVLIDRLNVLEHESTLAQLREDALTEELKQRETERCAAKWACLAHKLLTKQKRYSHFAEVAKLKGRCTNMEQRLTKFADGLRLRSKAGGARALTHEQLDLLSPRTVSPAISDDEGVFTPTNTTPRRRLARRFRPAADIQVAPSVLVQLPGKLGEMEVNRANTLRETGKAMQQAVENGIRHISYAAVVQRPKTTPVQDACSGGISSPTPRAKTGPQWKSFQPSMLGDDVDAFNDERQWAALFDGAGTDPGCFGANSLAHGSNAEPEDPQFDEIDRQEVSSVMPFIGVPPPGSRGGARKSRGARHRPVLATAEQLAGENGRMDGGSCQDAEAMAGEDLPSATSEVLDSARDMPSEAARLKQPGAAPPTAPPLQRHPVPSLNLTGINSCARGTEDSPLLDEDEADGARPDLDDASKQPLPDTDRAFQGPYRMRHDNAWDDPFGSQFDRDLVPRSALLELKLRHSLKIRSMQRAFEERLQIVNSYWHDQGMYMLDRKHATSQGTSTSARSSGVHSMPGSRTGARPEATIMNFSHYKGPYRDGRPERLSTPGSEVSGQPWWDSTTWPRDDGSVPHYRSPTRQTSPLRHQKHVQGDSIRHGLLNSQGRPVPAHVLEAARPSSKDGSSWLEVNTLEPKYHAFIYPSQRAISTRQEDKEELTKHNLRTHVKTHVVKPYHKRKAAASTDGKHPAAAQNRPGSKVSAREAAT